MNAEKLLIEAANETEHRVRKYSGRCMYVGVVGENAQGIVSDLLKKATYILEREYPEDGMMILRDLIDLCSNYRTDSMGEDKIIYWHVDFESNEE